jgi:ferrous iron transport protein B
LTTILIAPLMSCSARLPVYVLLIGAVIEPRYGPTVAALTLFGLHLVGLVIALPMALLFNRGIFKVKRSPFLMEMPPYRVPLMRDALWRMLNRGVDFLRTAGSIILAMAIAIWALSYFPRSPETVEQARVEFVQSHASQWNVSPEQAQARIEAEETLAGELDGVLSRAHLEQSYLGRMGQAIQPVFAPAGFDWRMTVGVLASFPAREVFVATLGITYNLGTDVSEDSPGLLQTLQNAVNPDGSPTFTVPVALSVGVFFALCMQCMATLSVIKKEAGWKWAGLTFGYMTALAWIGAVATYQVGNWMMGAG